MLIASKAELTELGYQQLWTYHQLLRERNGDGDLTRIHAFESMVTLHYVDCILVAQKLGTKLPSPLLDIGSGAGFPGIPLKIAAPHVEVILSEGRQRRVNFMDDAIVATKLTEIQTFSGKTYNSFSHPVQGVITRALEKIPVTLARIRSFLPPGGLAIFMKGPNCDDEIDQARRELANAFQLEDNLAYTLPFSTHDRRIVTFRRLHDAREVVRRRSRAIDSESNESFKDLRALLTTKGARKAGSALIAGQKLVAEVLRDFPARCEEILSPRGLETLPFEAPPDLPLTILAPALFKQLDVSGTDSPILRIRVEDPQPWQGIVQGCVLAVPFQDPENVGAVLRSAAAFGVQDVILTSESASPWHPKALRAGGSAALRVRLWRGGTLAEMATRAGAQLLALSADGRPMQNFAFPADFLLLPGTEGAGLPAQFRPKSLAIPMEGGSESLNAATATAVALYAWYTAALATDVASAD